MTKKGHRTTARPGALTRRTLAQMGALALASPLIASTASFASPAYSRHCRKKCGRRRESGNGKSVIVVTIDDMAGSVFEHPDIVLPNFARLGGLGTNFRAAMAHVPACSPSRGSMWSGVAANKSGVYDNSSNHKHGVYPAGHKYLFDWIKGETGGYIKGTGKVYHGVGSRLVDDWDAYYVPAGYIDSIHDKGYYRSLYEQHHQKDGQFDFGPGNNGALGDDAVTSWATDRMAGGYLVNRPGSALAVGLYRPHAPHVVPQQYFSLYPSSPALPPAFIPGASIYSDNDVDLLDEPPKAQNGPSWQGTNLDEFGEHDEFLRAYLASCSFADAKLGEIIDAWENQGLDESTYLVVTSDHGWQLGEKMRYSKFTLWDTALRVPLYIAGPGITADRTVQRPVGLLDLYPTICGLLGIDVPDWCDGMDLSGVLLSDGVFPNRPIVSIWPGVGGQFYSSARNASGRIIDYNGGPRSGYDHDTSSPTYDPYEWNNIADTMDQSLKSELINALPTTFEPPV